MKLLDFFSIRQKLAILLLFLLSAVSYLTINAINNTEKYTQNSLEIEVAQQQSLIAEQFINNLLFITRQPANTNLDNSELNKQQFIFNKNLQAMLLGGKAYRDLDMQQSINLDPIKHEYINVEIQNSEGIWGELQTASKTLLLKSRTESGLRSEIVEQLSIVQHLADRLRDNLSKVSSSLINENKLDSQKSVFGVKISWLVILIVSSLFSWLIARNITQPLDNITKAASRIRLGDLQHYPEQANKRDELGTLIYEANEMRLALSSLIIKIQQHSKQILLSSSHLDEFFKELNTAYQLQLDQHANIDHQVKNLQQSNHEYFELLLQHGILNNTNKQMIDSACLSINASVASLEGINNNHNVCRDNITNLQFSTESLYIMLSDLKGAATTIQNLAKDETLKTTESEQKVTSITDKITESASKMADYIVQITPQLKLLQSQIDYLPTPLQHIDQVVTNLQQQLMGTTYSLQAIKEGVEKQQYKSDLLVAQNKQHGTQLKNLQKTIESSLKLITENNDKTEANLLLTKDLNKISQHIDELSSDFKTDERDKRARRGNDKRLFPRINNQVKVMLQQGEKRLQGLTQDISLSGLQVQSLQSVAFTQDEPITFIISLPSTEPENSGQSATLLCDIVHLERQEEIYYYRVNFHSISDNDKAKIQQIFDYFDKKSEFQSYE